MLLPLLPQLVSAASQLLLSFLLDEHYSFFEGRPGEPNGATGIKNGHVPH